MTKQAAMDIIATKVDMATDLIKEAEKIARENDLEFLFKNVYYGQANTATNTYHAEEKEWGYWADSGCMDDAWQDSGC